VVAAATPHSAAMRSYLLTVGQFADIAEQEMYREPGRTWI
jgi:hypothetical protein